MLMWLLKVYEILDNSKSIATRIYLGSYSCNYFALPSFTCKPTFADSFSIAEIKHCVSLEINIIKKELPYKSRDQVLNKKSKHFN